MKLNLFTAKKVYIPGVYIKKTQKTLYYNVIFQYLSMFFLDYFDKHFNCY